MSVPTAASILARIAQLAGNAAADEARELWRAWDALDSLWRTKRILASMRVEPGASFRLSVNVQRDIRLREDDLVVIATDALDSTVMRPDALLELDRGAGARIFYPLQAGAECDVYCGNILWARGRNGAPAPVTVSMFYLRDGSVVKHGMVP